MNLLENGYSWNQVLQRISPKETLPQIQNNTLKYEYIILPQKEQTTHALTYGGKPITFKKKLLIHRKNTENSIKKALCKELGNKSSSYYDKLVEMNADNYITTNYELFLPQKFGTTPQSFGSGLLYKFRSLEYKGEQKTFWNIHGDTENPEEIVLGLSDYCKNVFQINKHLNSTKQEQQPSWINLFFETDVHILGLAMSYEEIDLWDVLTTRKRIRRAGSDNCQNNIYYYAIQDESYDSGKMDLLKALDVNVTIIKLVGTDYANAYEQIFQIIKTK